MLLGRKTTTKKFMHDTFSFSVISHTLTESPHLISKCSIYDKIAMASHHHRTTCIPHYFVESAKKILMFTVFSMIACTYESITNVVSYFLADETDVNLFGHLS